MAELPLRGCVALVTGASRGIGRAIALEAARAGADVAVLARSTEGAPSRLPGTIEEVAREVEALGRRALALAADVTCEDQVQAAAERTLAVFGRLDLLVNNAAYHFPAQFRETPLRRWDLVMAVNLRGAVACTQAFLPSMMERRSGHIVNISSGLAVEPMPGHISYAVSKAALETLTRGLAAELEPYGVAVNALRIDRRVASEGATFLNPEGDYSGWEKPEATARTAVWLASRPPLYTGQVVSLTEARERLGSP